MNFKKSTICLFKREVIIVFFACFILLFEWSFVYSATVDELKDQIQKVTATKIKLEEEIAVYEKQLSDIAEQTTSLKNTIKSLDATINKNYLDIKLTQSKINTTELEIQGLSIDIEKSSNKINLDTQVINLLINQVNMHDSSSIIENILSYKNLSDFWNEEQNIYLVQNQIKEKIIETKETKQIFEKDKKDAESKKMELLKLKSSLIDRQNLLDITKKEKNKILAETKNSETNYKKLLDEKKVMAEAFENELTQFESQLKFSIDTNSFPSVGKGILSWPLDNIKINQYFGMTEFAKTTNAYNGQGHNGVDFKASIGTPLKASLSGVVKGTGNTDLSCPGASFGQWILIEHNNGLSTLYGHLSLIKVSVGQIVTTGDIIGYSGNTGFSTGPHLHFGVYVTQGVKIMSRKSSVCKTTYTMPVADLRAYLDPLQYL